MFVDYSLRRYGPASAKRSRSSQLPPTEAIPVSILRPLKGLDPSLYDNLETSFLQDYPVYEVIFSVPNEADPAVRIVRTLMEKYPHVDAHLQIGEEIVGINPKVNNLNPAYKQAKYDLLWICDSNVSTTPGTLGRSVDLFMGDPRIGLVHHLPFSTRPDHGTGSTIEQVFLNTTHAKMYVAINRVAIDSCVMGKSNLYRRSVLDDVARKQGYTGTEEHGGLAHFGQYLAEDNMIGMSIWHTAKMRHAMSADLAYQALGAMTVSAYFARRARWIRVRKRMVTAATLVEPMTECFLAGIIGVWGLSRLRALSLSTSVLFWLIQTTLWCYQDYTIFKHLANVKPDHHIRSPLDETPEVPDFLTVFLPAWISREGLALPIWIWAITGNTVTWREQRYKVLENSKVVNLPKGKQAWWSRNRYVAIEDHEEE